MRSAKGFSVDLGLPWSLIFDVLFSYFFLFPVPVSQADIAEGVERVTVKTEGLGGDAAPKRRMNPGAPSWFQVPVEHRVTSCVQEGAALRGAAFPPVGPPGGFCRQTR